MHETVHSARSMGCRRTPASSAEPPSVEPLTLLMIVDVRCICHLVPQAAGMGDDDWWVKLPDLDPAAAPLEATSPEALPPLGEREGGGKQKLSGLR